MGDTDWNNAWPIWYKDQAGNVIRGGERELIPNLDELPFPALTVDTPKAYPLYALALTAST